VSVKQSPVIAGAHELHREATGTPHTIAPSKLTSCAPRLDGHPARGLDALGVDPAVVLGQQRSDHDSGIMTFIIKRDGVVYQRDLGPDTQKVAAWIAEYNPTDNWVPAE
jgi:hypothetical protein